ncbi:MAG TPA: glutamine--fructose-6-phosphate transaminase (isomerizing) [Methanocorpusculum sp.]|nr:glutamine--fructose-6-phosphate transaminase (isomerizing) [Methanocorpusculum sp.]
MCGIVGYVGYRNAGEVCREGLLSLEYRGYDSYGIAALTPEISIFKKSGRISESDELTNLSGCCAIGHTRWATHGVPNEINAHPHTDCKNKIAVVHNGIIENYAKLKHGLVKRGHTFKSDTDTEVIPHLIEEKYNGDLFDAVSKVLPMLEGSYALLVICEGEDKIIAARKGSPLVFGIGDSEFILASDALPLLKYTRQAVYFEDGDVAEITKEGYCIKNGKKSVKRDVVTVEWTADEVRRGGFEHYMLKEIYEQPEVFSNTVNSIKDYCDALSAIKSAKSITIAACGSSAHASMIFSYLFEKFFRVPVRVVLASEFKYFPPPITDLVIGVSQSGETADTLAALKLSKEMGAKTIAVTNVLGSSITRAADYTIFTRAGPEMSVAATKSFTSQAAAFMEIVNILSDNKLDAAIKEIQRFMPEVISKNVNSAVKLCKSASTLLYVGRGLLYPAALEGALKMKEISYIHAEGYAAGELKHGPFALLSKDTPVVSICLPGTAYSVMMSNLKEIKARKAPLIVIGTERDKDLKDISDVFISIPKVSEYAGAVLSSVILQIIAYHTAKELGTDIDMPRNLAKSVTVE